MRHGRLVGVQRSNVQQRSEPSEMLGSIADSGIPGTQAKREFQQSCREMISTRTRCVYSKMLLDPSTNLASICVSDNVNVNVVFIVPPLHGCITSSIK